MADSMQSDPSQFQTPFDLQLAKTPNFINAAYSTPSQRAQLYAFANEMMKPGEIKNGWQGMAEIARALVGGYTGHLADQYESQNYAHNMGQTTPGGGGGAPPAAMPYAEPTAGGGGGSPAPAPASPSDGQASPMAAAAALGAGTPFGTSNVNPGAASAGVNPNARGMRNNNPGNLEANDWTSTLPGYKGSDGRFAIFDTPENGAAAMDRNLRSYGSKGISTPHAIAASWAPGKEKGNNPDSYGAQIASSLGVGPNDHIDLGDPNVRAKVGASIARVENGPGKGTFNALGYAAAAPAAAAIGQALTGGGRPTQVAQNLPFTPQQLGAMAANPNLPDHIRAMAMHLTQPQTMTDALGNVIPVQQNSAAGAPIAHLGVLGPAGSVGGIPTQPVYSGTPKNPQVNTLTPVGPLGGGQGDWTQNNLDRLRGLATTGAEISGDAAAHGKGIEAAGAASTDQFARDRLQAANFQRSALPLQKAIPLLEKLGPQGTGPGSEGLNQVLSFLQTMGVQIQDPSKIQSFDEAKKYLTDFVNQNGDHSTNDKFAAAFAGSPNVGVSNAASLDVAKTALGMMRYKQAMYQAAAKQNVPPEKYADFANGFNNSVDPRAFGIDMMTPQAMSELKKELGAPTDNTPARQKFMRSLQIAQDLGLVQKRQ